MAIYKFSLFAIFFTDMGAALKEDQKTNDDGGNVHQGIKAKDQKHSGGHCIHDNTLLLSVQLHMMTEFRSAALNDFFHTSGDLRSNFSRTAYTDVCGKQ